MADLRKTLLAVLATAAITSPVLAQRIISPAGESPAELPPSYPDLAALVLKAPLVIDATVRSTERLKGPDALGAPPGYARLLMTVDVLALVRGSAALPQRVQYVALAPVDAKGRIPNLKRTRLLVFAAPVAGSGSQVQLVGPDAQRPWSAAADAMVRAIAQEVVSPNAPPAITGIGNAFHVPGTLPGEGETQIFLTTATGKPVSLSILSRPNEAKSWAVALSEIVDESAKPPARETLLWYRLACGLPAQLPEKALTGLSPDDGAAAQEDYRFVLGQLGSCR